MLQLIFTLRKKMNIVIKFNKIYKIFMIKNKAFIQTKKSL